jgi:hypothetical protein
MNTPRLLTVQGVSSLIPARKGDGLKPHRKVFVRSDRHHPKCNESRIRIKELAVVLYTEEGKGILLHLMLFPALSVW